MSLPEAFVLFLEVSLEDDFVLWVVIRTGERLVRELSWSVLSVGLLESVVVVVLEGVYSFSLLIFKRHFFLSWVTGELGDDSLLIEDL